MKPQARPRVKSEPVESGDSRWLVEWKASHDDTWFTRPGLGFRLSNALSWIHIERLRDREFHGSDLYMFRVRNEVTRQVVLV